jgi:hypothetical protein
MVLQDIHYAFRVLRKSAALPAILPRFARLVGVWRQWQRVAGEPPGLRVSPGHLAIQDADETEALGSLDNGQISAKMGGWPGRHAILRSGRRA